MSFDLTNKNISDTFQNLLQKTGSNNQLYDLQGNHIMDLTIGGTLHAHSYAVSQSVIYVSSGSNIFGNSDDDTHTFQGNITASGNISSSGIGTFNQVNLNTLNTSEDTTHYITFHKKLGLPTALNTTNGLSFNPSSDTLNLGGSKIVLHGAGGHITASGNISSSGTIKGNSYQISNQTLASRHPSAGITLGNSSDITNIDGVNIKLNAPVTASGNISASGYLSTNSHITASGNISSSGNISANQLQNITRLTFDDGIYLDSSNGNVDFSNGIRTQNAGPITASGNISSSGNVMGNNFKVDGNNMLAARHSSGKITLANDSDSVEIDATNIRLDAPVTASGNISASSVTGNHSFGGLVSAYSMSIGVNNPFDSHQMTFKSHGGKTYINDELFITGSAPELQIKKDGGSWASGEIAFQILHGNDTVALKFIPNLSNAGLWNGAQNYYGPTSDIYSKIAISSGHKFYWDNTGAGDTGIKIQLSDSLMEFNKGQDNIDFEINGNTNTNLFFADASTERIGIGTGTPSKKLEVSGSISGSGDLYIGKTGGAYFSASGGQIDISGSLSQASLDVRGQITASGNISSSATSVLSVGGLQIVSGTLDIKNLGAQSQIRMYCEDANAHFQTIKAAPHSDGASNTLQLPSVGTVFATTDGSQTFTNKTLTSPDINTPDIDGGNMDNTVIGASIRSTARFTGVEATRITASAPGIISSSYTSLASFGSVFSATNITASGTITAGGNIIAESDITASGNISSSITSTGSFGTLHLEGSNFTSASLASAIAGGGGSGPSATTVSGSWRGELSSSNKTDVGGGVSGSSVSTASFGRLEGDGSGLTGLSSAAISSVSNFGDNNRVITAAGGAAVNAEANLTFDGDGLNVNGHITASGNISASHTSTASFGHVTASTFSGDGSGLTGLSSAAISSYTNNGNNRVVTSVDASTVNGEANLTFDGTQLLVTGNISASGGYRGSRTFDTGSNIITGVGKHSGGDIVYFGQGSLTIGKLYYLAASGTWTETNATDNSAGADELLGIALGSTPTTHGVLLRGVVSTADTSNLQDAGKAHYMSATSGLITSAKPSSTNNIVRIVGYSLHADQDILYFNPSAVWVKIA